MIRDNLGDILKLTRLQRKINLESIESITNIPLSILEIIESNQFDAIPEEVRERYLQKYCLILGINFDDYVDKGEAESQRLDENISEISNSRVVSSMSRYSRAGYYNDEDKENKTNYLPLICLVLISLGILNLIVYSAINQKQSTTESSKNYHLASQETSETSTSTTSSSEQEKQDIDTTLTLSGDSFNTLNVSVKTTQTPISVEISLSDAESSWVSVTNSSDGLEGTLLSTENKSYSTTLLPDVTTSLITLGVTKGVTLKVNNQTVDLSSLSSLDLSYITLTIE